jgi:DNA-binding SARP family transcriptional activator
MVSAAHIAGGGVFAARLEMLDGFRLEANGVRLTPLASAQRLLAFLALRGPAARVVTAGTLWADVPEEFALASLRTTMWRCNRMVPGMVAVEQNRLALADFVATDVTELASGATTLFAGSAQATLLALRRGELLPGWYEDWAVFERERLRHLRLHALEAAAGQFTASGQYAVSLELALEAVRCEPLRESAHRAVILVHLAENNVAEALREFERFRELLIDQIGVEPSEDLADLVFAGRRRARHRIGPATRSTGATTGAHS